MELCENLLSRGILNACDNSVVWFMVLLVILLLILITLVVKLIINNSKLKHKQKHIEDLNMGTKDFDLKRLLAANCDKDSDVTESSMVTLVELVNDKQTEINMLAPLAEKLAMQNHKLEGMKQAVYESELLREAINVTGHEVDFEILRLLASTSDQPLACVLLEQGPSGYVYLQDKEIDELTSLVMANDGAIDLLVDLDVTVNVKVSELPSKIIDKLIHLFLDYDVSERTIKIVSNLATLQLKNDIRKSARGNYVEIVRKMKATFHANDVDPGLDVSVDKFKSNRQAISSPETAQASVSESDSEVDINKSESVNNNNESQSVNQAEESVNLSDSIIDGPILLGTGDDAFIHDMFEKKAPLRFKIHEWKIELKQPIDFQLIGKDKTEELLLLVEKELKTLENDPSLLRTRDILSSVLERM